MAQPKLRPLLKKDGTPRLNRNGRPISEMTIKSHHQHMLISPEEIEAIDNFMFANRITSRAETMRQLISFALEHKANEGNSS